MIDTLTFRADGLRKRTLRISYNYCGICGHTPKTNADEPNYAPLRWWDSDDGWKIGTLCHWCHDEVANDAPKPTGTKVCDDCNTDEDPSLALPDEPATPQAAAPSPQEGARL
jgi:hypothetical protein